MAIDREKVQANAQKFVDKKKYDKAIAELLKIVQEDPNEARTLLKVGDLYSKLADFPSAIATYERVGKFYAHQGFALKAIAVYKQIRELIVKHAPQLEDRYTHIMPLLADLFIQLGLTTDALATLDEIATRYQQQGRESEALAVLRQIVRLDPTNPLPHLRLAEALSRLHDADAAVKEFGDAATLLVKLGRRDDAIKVFERLLHLKPDIGFAHQCAELYLDRGVAQDGMLALAKLQLCFQADPKNLATLTLLARAFGAIGQANKGIEVQKEMARLAKEQGQLELFRELLDKLLRVAPNDEQVKALAVTSTRLPAASSQPDPAPTSVSAAVLRQSSTSEPSEGSVDSVDFVDEAEIEEVVDDAVPSAPREAIPAVANPHLRTEVRASDPKGKLPTPPRRELASTLQRRPQMPSAPEVEIEEEALLLDESSTSDDATEISSAVTQALADAASFRRVKLYTKAIESLETAVLLNPTSREAHEALRDVQIEIGNYRDAATHLVALAEIELEAGDVDAAVRGLYKALSLHPGLQPAEALLQSLGYELPTYEDEATDAHLFAPSFGDRSSFRTDPAASDSDAPVPASVRGASQGSSPSLLESQTDEEAPLPRFPLPAESEPAFELVSPRRASTASRPPNEADTGRAPSVPTAELEGVLEEADFFASRGLFDDARTILNEQLALHPRHILLRERLVELDVQEQAAVEISGPRQPSRSPPVLDRSFDIAASLDAIEHLDTTGASFDDASQQVDVEEVFAAFKEGVAKQVSVDDAQSHYDLGVAYKEMGLLVDAIREFEVAARDEKRNCVCRSMVGYIQMERGKVPEAIDAFKRGLASAVKTAEQEMVLCYEIGAAYDSIGRTKEAVSYLQRVASRDPSFRDVEGRLRRLGGRSEVKPAVLAAASPDDELDRAFDDMLDAPPPKTGSND